MKKLLLHLFFCAVCMVSLQFAATAQTVLVTPDGRVLGGSAGAFVLSAPVNQMPVASVVTVNGTPTVGQVLTVLFTYTDAESDPAGVHRYKWYRADDATGTNLIEISGATGYDYILVAPDVGKYITAGVIPVATSGTTPGAELRASVFAGPITFTSGDNLPVAHVIDGVSPVAGLTSYGTYLQTLPAVTSAGLPRTSGLRSRLLP